MSTQPSHAFKMIKVDGLEEFHEMIGKYLDYMPVESRKRVIIEWFKIFEKETSLLNVDPQEISTKMLAGFLKHTGPAFQKFSQFLIDQIGNASTEHEEIVKNMRAIIQSGSDPLSPEEIINLKNDLFPKLSVSEKEAILVEDIAAATIGRVVRIKEGSKTYVVKIRREDVVARFELDKKRISAIIAEVASDNFFIQDMIDSIVESMEKELDFRNERSNIRKIQKAYAGADKSVKVVQLADIDNSLLQCALREGSDLAQRYMIMDEIEGEPLSKVLVNLEKQGTYSEEKIKQLANAYLAAVEIYGYEALIGGGFVPSDPHPGNFIVNMKSDPVTITYLDLGSATEVSFKNKAAIVSLGYAVYANNSDKFIASMKAGMRSGAAMTPEFETFLKKEFSDINTVVRRTSAEINQLNKEIDDLEKLPEAQKDRAKLTDLKRELDKKTNH